MLFLLQSLLLCASNFSFIFSCFIFSPFLSVPLSIFSLNYLFFDALSSPVSPFFSFLSLNLCTFCFQVLSSLVSINFSSVYPLSIFFHLSLFCCSFLTCLSFFPLSFPFCICIFTHLLISFLLLSPHLFLLPPFPSSFLYHSFLSFIYFMFLFPSCSSAFPPSVIFFSSRCYLS